ncbi:hypothetical protein K2X85_01705 [bacterium]|nr:hypothetical protein [bacterium]
MSTFVLLMKQFWAHGRFHGLLMIVLALSGWRLRTREGIWSEGVDDLIGPSALLVGLFYLLGSYLARAGEEDWLQLRLVGAKPIVLFLIMIGQAILVAIIGAIFSELIHQVMTMFSTAPTRPMENRFNSLGVMILFGISAILGSAYPSWRGCRVDLSERIGRR